jgi:ketosteroid isomerase-like protein
MKNQNLTCLFVITTLACVLPSLAQAAGKGDVTSAVRAMEDKWETAIGKKDATTIQGMMADDFVGVSSKGKRTGKALVLSQVKKDTDTYTSTRNSNVKVSVMGSNVAIAIGDAVEKGKGKDGQSFDRTYRWTDTWMERNGKWQCVGSHVSQISGSRSKD